MALNYAIATVSDYNALSSEDKATLVAGIKQDSFDTCKRTISGTDEFIGKWDGGICPFDTVSLSHTDYSYTEILVEIAKAEWTTGEV